MKKQESPGFSRGEDVNLVLNHCATVADHVPERVGKRDLLVPVHERGDEVLARALLTTQSNDHDCLLENLRYLYVRFRASSMTGTR